MPYDYHLPNMPKTDFTVLFGNNEGEEIACLRYNCFAHVLGCDNDDLLGITDPVTLEDCDSTFRNYGFHRVLPNPNTVRADPRSFAKGAPGKYDSHGARRAYRDVKLARTPVPPSPWLLSVRGHGLVFLHDGQPELAYDAEVDKVVVYGGWRSATGKPPECSAAHFCRRVATGWESKMGYGALIRHRTLNNLVGTSYGKPMLLYAREVQRWRGRRVQFKPWLEHLD